jgi:hypothetical protein
MDGHQKLGGLLIEIGLQDYIIDLFTENQDSLDQLEK